LRNAVMPNLHAQLQYKLDAHIIGAGVDYKSLVPSLEEAEKRINTLAAIAYLRLDLAPVTFKVEGVMGDNLADLLMLGGYAEKSIAQSSSFDEYTPIGSWSLWGELIYGKEIEVAVFAAYARNTGAREDAFGFTYARGSTIDHMYRVSPRVQW